MAKKKKEEFQEKFEKHSIQNTSKYSGDVKITFKRGNKPIKVINTHNTGTINICNYLRSALAGECINAERPGKITACVKEGSKLEDFTGFCPLSKMPEKISYEEPTNKSSVKLTFIIPSTSLPKGQSVYGFNLYSSVSTRTNKIKFAEIDLTNIYDKESGKIIDLSFRMDGNVNLEVEWTLNVSF